MTELFYVTSEAIFYIKIMFNHLNKLDVTTTLL